MVEGHRVKKERNNFHTSSGSYVSNAKERSGKSITSRIMQNCVALRSARHAPDAIK